MLKPFLSLLVVVLTIFSVAGCGGNPPNQPPLTGGGGTPPGGGGGGGGGGAANTAITKYSISGATITPSSNNPFTNQVSVASFGATSATTVDLITITKSTTPGNPVFSENISVTGTAQYPAFQQPALSTSQKSQQFGAHGDALGGTEGFRRSEIQLLQNGVNLQSAPMKAKFSALGNATPDTVGTQVNFWVNTGNSLLSGDVQIAATCRYVGTNVYIYVDNDIPDATLTTNNSPTLQAIVAAFDTPVTGIYYKDTATFGQEYKPGIDGDNHITILISPAVNNRHAVAVGSPTGTLGYFWGRDEWTRTTGTGTVTDDSNEREMFYVSYEYQTAANTWTPIWADAAANGPNSKNGYAILAHEFQHMINYYQKVIRHYDPVTKTSVVEEPWLNEGLSMYAMQACGYGMPQGDSTSAVHVKNYLDFPESYSLTTWTVNNYGMSYLFVLYLVEQYGTGILQTMESNSLTGIANVESIPGVGTGNFGTVFKNWAMANLLDGVVSNPVYNYASINLSGTYGGVTLTGVAPFIYNTYPQNRTYPTNFGTTAVSGGWSAVYQRFSGGTNNALNLSISSTSTANNLEGVVVVK